MLGVLDGFGSAQRLARGTLERRSGDVQTSVIAGDDEASSDQPAECLRRRGWRQRGGFDHCIPGGRTQLERSETQPTIAIGEQSDDARCMELGRTDGLLGTAARQYPSST